MPEKKTLEKAKRAKRQGKSTSTQAGAFVKEEIEHVRKGKHGAKSAKQAIAIGLSKARRAGVALKPPAKGSVSAKTLKSVKSATRLGKKHKPVSKTRSTATRKALKKKSTRTVSRAALSKQTKSASKKRTPAERSQAAKKAVKTKRKVVRSVGVKTKGAKVRSVTAKTKGAKVRYVAVKTKRGTVRSVAVKKTATSRARKAK